MPLHARKFSISSCGCIYQKWCIFRVQQNILPSSARNCLLFRALLHNHDQKGTIGHLLVVIRGLWTKLCYFVPLSHCDLVGKKRVKLKAGDRTALCGARGREVRDRLISIFCATSHHWLILYHCGFTFFCATSHHWLILFLWPCRFSHDIIFISPFTPSIFWQSLLIHPRDRLIIFIVFIL